MCCHTLVQEMSSQMQAWHYSSNLFQCLKYWVHVDLHVLREQKYRVEKSAYLHRTMNNGCQCRRRRRRMGVSFRCGMRENACSQSEGHIYHQEVAWVSQQHICKLHATLFLALHCENDLRWRSVICAPKNIWLPCMTQRKLRCVARIVEFKRCRCLCTFESRRTFILAQLPSFQCEYPPPNSSFSQPCTGIG